MIVQGWDKRVVPRLREPCLLPRAVSSRNLGTILSPSPECYTANFSMKYRRWCGLRITFPTFHRAGLRSVCSITEEVQLCFRLGNNASESLKYCWQYDFNFIVTVNTGLGKRVVPRLRELTPCGQRESGGRIHAT